MNNDFFNYLVSTDELDDFLGYEPRCPNCTNKMIKIVYGMPDTDTMEKAQRGELFLGGCVIEEFQPEYHCNKCRRSYNKNLDEYIEESNNWEDE